jgi:predicted alpha/beta superfamily hydrolase
MSADEIATLHVEYPRGRGGLKLRGGGAGLSWFDDRAPDHTDGDVSVFHVEVPRGAPVPLKVLRDDGAWMTGRNAVLSHGEHLRLRPCFERSSGTLSTLREVKMPWHGETGASLHMRVWLPPSYGEHDDRRYPVLYAQDGQSIWSDGTDPYGTWGFDHVLDALWDQGAIDDVIVVSLDTGERRIERLGPVADERFGGGAGPEHLRGMVEGLRPVIDAEYRTQTAAASTVLMGSSMGGLFSFYGAWMRPDVFGGAICLSSSFWFADRFMVRAVQTAAKPKKTATFYLDSGVAASGCEDDASTRDGVYNTRAMAQALRDLGLGRDQLHLLSWSGHRHDGPSWASRVGTPLQLFFPRAR